MPWWEVILYIFAFAIVTAILYIWGVNKSRNKQRDLLRALYEKAECIVIRSLKKKGTMTKAEIDAALVDVKASLFYSKSKIKIQDPTLFSEHLLDDMCKKGRLQRQKLNHENVYFLAEKSKEKD